MVPSAVSLFSSAVPCHRALLAYLARSDRITVIMYRPPASKNAMPVGFAPYRSTLVPSPFFCSHETSVHVPTSCFFSDSCWAAALSASNGSSNIAVTHGARVRRKSIALLPERKRSRISREGQSTLCGRERYHVPSDGLKA